MYKSVLAKISMSFLILFKWIFYSLLSTFGIISLVNDDDDVNFWFDVNLIQFDVKFCYVLRFLVLRFSNVGLNKTKFLRPRPK